MLRNIKFLFHFLCLSAIYCCRLKILLVPPKSEIIIVLSNYLFFNYLVLTAALCKRLHHRFTNIPSPYRRVNTALSSRHYQRLPLRITFRRTDWSFVTIRREVFQRVGRTIFIKSKLLLFLYTLIISTQIFKILIFLPSHNPF